MDFATALALAAKAVSVIVQYAPEVVAAFPDIKLFAVDMVARLTGQAVTADQLDLIEARVDALHNELQQPMDEA